MGSTDSHAYLDAPQDCGTDSVFDGDFVTVSHPADLDKNRIVVVCSADEAYAMPMTVTLYSALANLRDENSSLLVFILDGGIQQSTKKKVLSSLDSNRIQIEWVKVNRKDFQHLPLKRHLTQAAYYRLSIGKILPNWIDKVIYLDSDMVVLGDLSKLWKTDVGDHYLLAVHDAGQPFFAEVKGLRNYQELGLDPQQEYFNSGLLVINLKRWRDEKIGLKAVQFLVDHKDTVVDLDQDALNAVTAGQWGKLDPRWNQMPHVYDYHDWKESDYDEATFNALLNSPRIVHYAVSKPWQINCKHPVPDFFLKYQKQTAWAGYKDTQMKRVFRKLKKELRRRQLFK